MSRPGRQSTREQQVARAFVTLADSLVDDYDVIDLLTRLVGYSVSLLEADAGAIMLADPAGRLRQVAASSEDAHLLELMQLQNDEGPCLDCFRTAAPVTVPDLERASERWPSFVAAAMRQPVFRSVYAVPLRLRGEALGALNLFHGQPGSMPVEDQVLGQALADVATISILHERAVRHGEVLNEQLQTALNSRVIIEQAKGVLAQHSGLPMDQAFNALRRYARINNLRLVDLARDVVERQLDPGLLVTTAQR
ncbi:GAF and ANTAR domain-containing protein [Pseudonocardia spinosispora]|uniref:GAF and ANTAR domain-containing protein n=1 Tax=Pseudonocardia spinosispora TaxID=103441 RepID=UPI00040D2981|nr:GAF and ANTAR domain-containing protein [Pseudonocardia spinosispora]